MSDIFDLISSNGSMERRYSKNKKRNRELNEENDKSPTPHIDEPSNKRKNRSFLDNIVIGDEEDSQPEKSSPTSGSELEREIGSSKKAKDLLEDTTTLDLVKLSTKPEKKQVKVLKREYVFLLDKLEEISEEVNKMSSSSKVNQSEFVTIQQENQNLRELIKSLSYQLPESDEIENFLSEKHWPTDSIEKLINRKIRFMHDRILNMDDYVENQLERIESEKENIENIYRNLKNDYESLLESNQQLSEENDNLNDQVSSLSSSVEDLQNENSRLTTEIEEFRNDKLKESEEDRLKREQEEKERKEIEELEQKLLEKKKKFSSYQEASNSESKELSPQEEEIPAHSKQKTGPEEKKTNHPNHNSKQNTQSNKQQTPSSKQHRQNNDKQKNSPTNRNTSPQNKKDDKPKHSQTANKNDNLHQNKRPSRKEDPIEVSTQQVLELETQIDHLSSENKYIIQKIGESGASRHSELLDVLYQDGDFEDYFKKDEDGKPNYKQVSLSVKNCIDSGYLNGEKPDLGSRGAKFYVYDLSKFGKTLFKLIFDKNPVVSNKQLVIDQHSTVEHGYLIVICAEELENQGYKVYTDREDLKFKTNNGQTVNFDLVIEDKGKKQYVEVERGTHTIEDFLEKLEKIYQFTGEFYFIAPRDEISTKYIVSRFYKWVKNHGINNLRGKVELNYTTLAIVKDQNRKKPLWETQKL